MQIVIQCALTLTEIQNDVTAESVFSHPVGSVPSALFHEYGSMRKTKLSDLGEVLEGPVSRQTELPPFDKDISVFIREAMGIIQTMNGNNFSTFGQLGQSYLQYLLIGFQFANTLVDIFDRYKDDSVKSAEMARSAAATGNA